MCGKPYNLTSLLEVTFSAHLEIKEGVFCPKRLRKTQSIGQDGLNSLLQLQMPSETSTCDSEGHIFSRSLFFSKVRFQKRRYFEKSIIFRLVHRWDEFDQMRRDMISESRQAWQKIDEDLQKLEKRSFSKSLNISSEEPQAKEENHTKISNGPSVVEKIESRSFSSSEPTIEAREVKEETRSKITNEAPVTTENTTEEIRKRENVEIPVLKEKKRDSEPLLESWLSPIKLVKFPSLFGDDGFNSKMSLFKEENVIKVKDDDKAFEITMDTSQYRPDELNVNVIGDSLTVEAKHTEQSEDGRNLVSKQFVRRYTLPNDCKADLVSSNLSADGVLVISAPKFPSITEISGRNVPILRA